MLNLITIIIKNFKLLIRNKSSALVVILGPVLLMVLVGMAFNTSNLYDLKLGVYSSSYSELTNSLIDQLDKDFTVVELEKENYCINGVKSGEYNVCAVIPPNLKVGSKDEIVFYADYSRMNIVYNIISTISSEINVKVGELSTDLTSDLLERLNDAKAVMIEKKSAINALKENNDILASDLDDIKLNLKKLDFEDLTEENDTYGMNSDLNKMADKVNDTITQIDTVKEKIETNSNDIEAIREAMNIIVTATSTLSVTEAEDIVNPIKTRIEPITSEKAHLSYLLPSLLVLVVMLISILLSSTELINEKSVFAYFRNFITPAPDIIFLFGHFLSNLIIVILELAVILGLSLIFFGQQFLNTALLCLVILSIGSIVFILLGMVIGYTFRSGETANLAAISISSLMLFFSNTILPLETLPSFVKGLASLNPFVVIESMLKRVMIFNASIGDQALGFLILIGYILLFGLLAYLANEATKRRL